MTKVMTPSVNTITAGQIGKFQELLGARLRKSGFLSEACQQVLATQGDVLADEMVVAIRKRVEAMDSIIVRRTKVDRSRAPCKALESTGRKLYVNDNVVAAMPKGEGEEVDVCFFKLDLSERGGWISDNGLEKEYALRGLKAADPYSQAAVNEADPTFADDHPNATHWKDADGKWCFAIFSQWLDECYVHVNRYDNDWYGIGWFAGLRK